MYNFLKTTSFNGFKIFTDIFCFTRAKASITFVKRKPICCRLGRWSFLALTKNVYLLYNGGRVDLFCDALSWCSPYKVFEGPGENYYDIWPTEKWSLRNFSEITGFFYLFIKAWVIWKAQYPIFIADATVTS